MRVLRSTAGKMHINSTMVSHVWRIRHIKYRFLCGTMCDPSASTRRSSEFVLRCDLLAILDEALFWQAEKWKHWKLRNGKHMRTTHMNASKNKFIFMVSIVWSQSQRLLRRMSMRETLAWKWSNNERGRIHFHNNIVNDLIYTHNAIVHESTCWSMSVRRTTKNKTQKCRSSTRTQSHNTHE